MIEHDLLRSDHLQDIFLWELKANTPGDTETRGLGVSQSPPTRADATDVYEARLCGSFDLLLQFQGERVTNIDFMEVNYRECGTWAAEFGEELVLISNWSPTRALRFSCGRDGMY